MTKDEIVQLAHDADCGHVNIFGDRAAAIERLSKFAQLVAAKERERCAKKCDDNALKLGAGLGNTALRVTAMDIRAGRV